MLFSAVLPSLQGKQEYKFHQKVGCKVCKVFSSKIIVSFTGKSSLNCLSSACAACVVRCARLVSEWQRPSIIEYGQALSPRQNGYTNIYEGLAWDSLGGFCSLPWFELCQVCHLCGCVWGNTLTGKKGEAATELSSPSYFGSLYDIFRVGFENIESVFKIALLQ